MKSESLPQPEKALLDVYFRLIEELEEVIASKCLSPSNNCLNCRPGCSECCMDFSILPFEAVILVQHLLKNELPPNTQDPHSCRMLLHGRCLVYAARPVICRTQGLAIGYLDEENGMIEVSCCPLNFAEDYVFSQQEILLLDDFNDRLARLNSDYCRSAGLDAQKRIAITSVVDFVARLRK